MNKLELPNLDRWRAGELPDEDMFNELQDAHEFLLDPPTCKVRKTSSQSISNNLFQTLSWSEAVEDNCKPFGVEYSTAMWDPVNHDNWQIYARVAGWYEVTSTVVWASRTDDGRRMMYFMLNEGLNETFEQRGRVDRWHLNNETIMISTWPVYMNVGDYIELVVFQQSGTTTSVTSPGPETGHYTSMKVKWVSL